jgi:hypothetical protein
MVSIGREGLQVRPADRPCPGSDLAIIGRLIGHSVTVGTAPRTHDANEGRQWNHASGPRVSQEVPR